MNYVHQVYKYDDIYKLTYKNIVCIYYW